VEDGDFMCKDKLADIFYNGYYKKHNYSLCIYCMGEYGLQLYFTLKEFGIQANCFGDSDTRKQGYVFDNMYCYSFDEIVSKKNDIVVIISMKNPQILIEKFNKAGVNYVLTKDEVLNIISHYKINKIDNTYAVKLDYTEIDYIININNFRKELYEVYCNGKRTIEIGKHNDMNSLEGELENILENCERYMRENAYEYS